MAKSSPQHAFGSSNASIKKGSPRKIFASGCQEEKSEFFQFFNVLLWPSHPSLYFNGGSFVIFPKTVPSKCTVSATSFSCTPAVQLCSAGVACLCRTAIFLRLEKSGNGKIRFVESKVEKERRVHGGGQAITITSLRASHLA